ncbi:hypothetical protein [Arcicella rosea]|nr:hypothetical protein [Arcicella rosea]
MHQNLIIIMEEKAFVPAILTAQWKTLQRGRNAKFRSGRFRDSMMKHLSLQESQVNTFYAIINGKKSIETGYIKYAMDLMKNCLLIK